MADLGQRLMAFLEPLEGKPTEWGRDDCSALCARWAQENGHQVEMPPYASEDEARRLIEKAGGLVNLWGDIAFEAGIQERHGLPEMGDVGIIDTRLFGPVGVICVSNGVCCWRTSRSAAWLAPRGYLKVWAIT